jgi:hypothetical protein
MEKGRAAGSLVVGGFAVPAADVLLERAALN